MEVGVSTAEKRPGTDEGGNLRKRSRGRLPSSLLVPLGVPPRPLPRRGKSWLLREKSRWRSRKSSSGGTPSGTCAKWRTRWRQTAHDWAAKPVDRVHDVGRLVWQQHGRIVILRAANKELKLGVSQEAVAVIEHPIKELQATVDQLRAELDCNTPHS
ncbi:hypothetical protein BHM03_00048017 [Ensete ventricosum]|nr:hypothetical protein BHM03_00048017 [Ensete ventricosum]